MAEPGKEGVLIRICMIQPEQVIPHQSKLIFLTNTLVEEVGSRQNQELQLVPRLSHLKITEAITHIVPVGKKSRSTRMM